MALDHDIKVHFLGASGTVTGSKYLLTIGQRKIMVDCGLFQGIKKLRVLNWEYPPVDVKDIDAVLLTHGHMDHTGYLPKLVNMGFNKPVYATQPTLDVAKIILKDSAKIQEREAKNANKGGYTKHKPAEPLYTMEDAEQAITLFTSVKEGQWLDLFPEVKVRFQCNGHIIGSAFIEIEAQGKHIVFSGDIGREEDLLMYPPKKPKQADVLFIESTYGDRLHPEGDVEEEIKNIVHQTVEEGRTLIIPSFAVERAQLFLYLFWKLKSSGAIPNIPVVLDSPMGAEVTDVFFKAVGWHKLSGDACVGINQNINITQSYKETLKWINHKGPKIIIAGSGMITGGRILTYLQTFLGDPNTTILLAGYQAEGTRGRQLLEGTPQLKIYGANYPVKAKVMNLQLLSGHADQSELIDWLSDIKNMPKKVFIVHGEAHAADTLRCKIKNTYGWDAKVPDLYSIEQL